MASDARHGNDIRIAPGVVSRRVGEEYVVVDPATDTAHALSGPTAAVWASIQDGSPIDVTDAATVGAVQEMVTLGLLVSPGLTRRSLLARGGFVGGAVVAANAAVVVAPSGIASMLLPDAAAAVSTIPTPVTTAGNFSVAIPAGTRQVDFTVTGAGGGAGTNIGGGNGASITGSVRLTSGATFGSNLYLVGTVGGAGLSRSAVRPLGEGQGGSGQGSGGSGGGGTTMRIGNNPAQPKAGTLIVVAGAGGGGGGATAGLGGQGGDAGQPGGQSNTGSRDGAGGAAGSDGVGGVGGGPNGFDFAGAGGGNGGAGAQFFNATATGGGGGGGYGGGAGGAFAAGVNTNTASQSPYGAGGGGGAGSILMTSAGLYTATLVSQGVIANGGLPGIPGSGGADGAGANGSLSVIFRV